MLRNRHRKIFGMTMCTVDRSRALSRCHKFSSAYQRTDGWVCWRSVAQDIREFHVSQGIAPPITNVHIPPPYIAYTKRNAICAVAAAIIATVSARYRDLDPQLIARSLLGTSWCGSQFLKK